MTATPTAAIGCGADVLVTGRVKTYPGGGVEILACSDAVFKPQGWEERKRPSQVPPRKKSTDGNQNQDHDNTDSIQSSASRERAMRRARAQVRDLALCTPFRWFVTLTLDPKRVDRHDMGEITRHLNHWLDNQVRRRGLAYVLVPERHKDGAIHFHGFFNDALKAVDSGTVSLPGVKAPRRPRSARQRAEWVGAGGQPVYNLPGWGWGFSTAIELYGDYNKAVSYVCKYIGKDGEKPGGRWYYSGGDLGRPEVSYEDIGFREVEALEGSITFSPDGSCKSFALVRVFPEYWDKGAFEKEAEKLKKIVTLGRDSDQLRRFYREIEAMEALRMDAPGFGGAARLTKSGKSTQSRSHTAAEAWAQVSLFDPSAEKGGLG